MTPKKILLVDDDVSNLYIMRCLLQNKGYEVADATNGADALQQARTTPPDLIVSDILMPVMDGFTLCRECKKDPRLRHIPFIFYTATYTDQKDKQFALDLGAVQFIVKPEDGLTFLSILEETLRKPVPTPPPVETSPAEEAVFLKQYSETLIRKLESKTNSLEKDIAQRELIEAALRNSEERFRLLVKNSSDSISVIDVHGTQRYISPAAERITGFPVEELLGKSFSEIIHPEDISRVQAAFQEAVAHPETRHTVRYRHIHKTKGWVHMEAVGQSALSEPSVNGVVVSARDISERVQNEEERDRLQSQLNQALKMESVGRLAGGVAHDFNNMLGVILGHTELAMSQIAQKHPLYANLLEIQKSAERSAELTRQLLAFARKQTVVPKVLDLNNTVENTLSMLRRLIGENIQLVWHPGTQPAPVKVDPSQIDQLLTNLCVNARDAIEGAGTITIETDSTLFDESSCAFHADRIPGEYVRLTVRDTGCGMDSDTLANIFEPFFTTKGVGEGTGLGLATVYGIVKQNHGFIDVQSQPAHGTTFHIYLPQHKSHHDPLPQNPASAPSSKGQETILLVEDEPAILGVSKSMLERMGYHVLGAGSPGEALRLAETFSGPIHLLMTDVVMPEINGRDLAKKLRSLQPLMRCLFMSGYTSDVIALHGVLDDGTHFIQKPFTMKALSEKVREALDRTA